MRKVTQNVHAHSEDGGTTVYLEKGEEVPDGYIVGDHVFEEVQEPEFVPVPGFGQVSVHELRRLELQKQSGDGEAAQADQLAAAQAKAAEAVKRQGNKER